ncbi:MAG: pilus assembly protein PilM [Candidatus Omnitrophica bacterium]|nr:pilus assembly protein PilM [Candidatus Omnitrophota bacterium]
MLNKSNECITVSLGEDILKVAQIKGSGSNTKITNILSQEVKDLSENDLSKKIQLALKNFNPKAMPVHLIVQPGMITTKNIEIPSIDPDEIKSIVNLQAGRHTPFSREEIQIGYVNIGIYKTNYTKVFLIIANRNLLKKQLAVFEKAGIRIEKILFASEGIAAFYSKILGAEMESAPVGIIDVGKDSTDFIITLKGLVIASRNIPIGKSQFVQDGADAKERLTKELEKTIESYLNEDIEQLPAKYIITSDDDDMKGIKEALEKKMKWTVEIIPYVDNIKATQGALKYLGTDSSFLDVVSSAVNAEESQVNLMPEDVLMQKSIETQSRELFTTAIQGLIILVLVASVLGLKVYFKTTYLSRLKNSHKDNLQEVAMLEQRSIETRIVHNYLSTRMVSLDTINELYKNIPSEMYLTSVSMDEDGRVDVQGISDIASLVFNLGTDLKESKLFKSVDIKSMTAKKDRGKDVSAFEIELKSAIAFSEPEDTPPENAKTAKSPQGKE